MRQLEAANAFKRDLKRESTGRYKKAIAVDLQHVVQQLRLEETLPDRLRDHALTGEWSDHRDCHIKPDLVLIYRKIEATRLQLVRLGSHSELSL